MEVLLGQSRTVEAGLGQQVARHRCGLACSGGWHRGGFLRGAGLGGGRLGAGGRGRLWHRWHGLNLSTVWRRVLRVGRWCALLAARWGARRFGHGELGVWVGDGGCAHLRDGVWVGEFGCAHLRDGVWVGELGCSEPAGYCQCANHCGHCQDEYRSCPADPGGEPSHALRRRFAGAERLHEGDAGWEPVSGLLLQGPQRRLLHRSGKGGVGLAHWFRLRVELLIERGCGVVGLGKRRLARHEFVEDHSQAVLVGPAVHHQAADHLGSHVARSARSVVHRHRHVVRPSVAEIDEDGSTVAGVDQDVPQRQVAVHHSSCMQRVEGVGDRAGQDR